MSRHGTVSQYSNRECRCAACKDAASAAARGGRPAVRRIDHGEVLVPVGQPQHGARRLSDDQVRQIRAAMSVQPRPRGIVTHLARRYRIRRDTIYLVAGRVTYRSVTDA